MMTNLKYWLKGLAVAAVSMIIYAVALGCYMALMLLVISMEEGGDNLSAFSVPLTEALVLLSQAYRPYRSARQKIRHESAWIRGRSGLLGSRKHLLRQKHKYRNR